MSKFNTLGRKQPTPTLWPVPAQSEARKMQETNPPQVADALRVARHLARLLHGVESLDELDWEAVTELCRLAQRVVQLLTLINCMEGETV